MTRRTVLLLTTLAGITGLALPATIDMPRALIWNASASVPVGLYRVMSIDALHVGDVAIILLPESLAVDLAKRRALPKGVRLLKPIAALAGQIVCREGARITIDGSLAGVALERDSRSQPLDVWKGCRTVRWTEVFVMNTDEPASFDGRYFGTLPMSSVVGRAVPLWIFKEH